MKDGNSKGLILAFSVVGLLILSSVSTLGTTVNSANDDPIQSNSVKIKSSAISIKMNSQSIRTSTVNINDNGFNTLDIEAFNNSENFVIANTTGNESYPAMISYGYDTFIAYEYEDNGDPQIYLRLSNDFGKNWTDAEPLEQGTPLNSPTLCYNSKVGINSAYGSFSSPIQNSQVVSHFDIPDISKFDLDIYTWDLSIYNSFWNMSNPVIVDHYLENAPWLTCYIGSTNYTDDEGVWAANDTLFYLFQNSSTGNPLDLFLQWDPTLENCSNVSLTTDNTSENMFGVCEKVNGSKHDLMIIIGDYVKGSTTSDPYIDIQYYNISSAIDHAHPKIYVKDDNIYIATEVDIGGMFDIMIYNSSDGGQTWGTYDPTGIVMAPPGEYVPKSPTIYANDTEIFCTYILDKNLSLTLSNDSGANWTNPIQINSVNSSAVEGYRFSDMPSENHIVWTDDREGNNDLYCIFQGTPPEYNVGIVPGSFQLVSTDFPILKTKNYVTYKIRNNGEHPIKDVLLEVTVNRSGNTPFTTAYPGYIKYLERGTELEFKEPLFRITLKEFIGAMISYIGVDFIKLEIVPSGAFPDSDPSDNIETIDDLNYGSIFPFFSFLG